MRKVPADWPSELKSPISLTTLQRTIPRQQRAKDFSIDLLNAVGDERYARVEALAAFLSRYDFGEFGPTVSRQFPSDEHEWMNLIVALCEYLDIPAFHVGSPSRTPGAKRKWTAHMYCMLFADVQKLVRGGMSAKAGCAYIARNAKKFDSRYLQRSSSSTKAWGNTLHRQFLNAQSEIKNNSPFRARYFSKQKWGPSLIAEAIERYGVKSSDEEMKSKKATRNP